MSMRYCIAVACVAALAVTASAQDKGADPSEVKTSNDLGYATYSEKVERVEVIVSSYGASFEESEKFFMLQVAVAAIGVGDALQFSDESFTLVDPQGNLYAMAPAEELAGEPKLLEFATEIQRNQPLQTDKHFANLKRVQSDFYVEDDLRWTTVNINYDEYFEDVVFFPQPESGFDGVFTLNVLTKGMKPVEVRFKLPPTKHHKKQDSSG